MTTEETKQKRMIQIIRIKMKHVKSEYNPLKTEPLQPFGLQLERSAGEGREIASKNTVVL